MRSKEKEAFSPAKRIVYSVNQGPSLICNPRGGRMRTRPSMGTALAIGAAFLTALGVTPVGADRDGHGGKGGEYEKGEYGHGGSGKDGYGGGHGMPGMGMMMHASTG